MIIPAGTTQYITRTKRDQHTERLRVFKEVTEVENTLKQQIVSAVDHQDLEALRDDPTTGRLSGSIYEVIHHLFHVYGKVAPQILYEQVQEVHQMVYDPQYPIGGVFTDINDLVIYCKAVQTTHTQAQSIILAYRIPNRT